MDSLPQGEGPLFTDPSADRAREWFAGKPRALTDKLTTVAEAVARLVHDGAYLVQVTTRLALSAPEKLRNLQLWAPFFGTLPA